MSLAKSDDIHSETIPFKLFHWPYTVRTMFSYLPVILFLNGLYTATCDDCYCARDDKVKVHIALLGVPVEVRVIGRGDCFHGRGPVSDRVYMSKVN